MVPCFPNNHLISKLFPRFMCTREYIGSKTLIIPSDSEFYFSLTITILVYSLNASKFKEEAEIRDQIFAYQGLKNWIPDIKGSEFIRFLPGKTESGRWTGSLLRGGFHQHTSCNSHVFLINRLYLVDEMFLCTCCKKYLLELALRRQFEKRTFLETTAKYHVLRIKTTEKKQQQYLSP